jgi:arylsulfatase A-like enzyme
MQGRWKAVRNKRRDSAIEIYDVSTDTGETMDLASRRPDLVREAVLLFERERRESKDWPVQEARLKP